MKRIFTKGNVEVQNIKVGDIHYEYEFGLGIQVTVTRAPELTGVMDGKDYWSWESVDRKGNTINYGVTDGLGCYGPNLYDYKAYGEPRL